MKNGAGFTLFLYLAIAFLCAAALPARTKYQARTWNVGTRELYSASLTSERITIAVKPFFTDALAAQVFNRDDMVTRGIMPLAVVVFNDNDFPVEVDAMSIELIKGEDHIRTMTPNEVANRLSKKEKSWISRQMPKASRSDVNKDELDDLDNKFLMNKTIDPHDKGGGFVYLHVDSSEDVLSYLKDSVVYIPKVYRRDNDSRLIFFEIELNPALKSAPIQ